MGTCANPKMRRERTLSSDSRSGHYHFIRNLFFVYIFHVIFSLAWLNTLYGWKKLYCYTSFWTEASWMCFQDNSEQHDGVFAWVFFLVDDFYKNSDSSRLVGIFCVPLWYTFFLLVLLFLGTSTDVDHTKNMCMQVDFCCLVVGPTTSSSRRDEHSFHFIRYFLWLACLAGSGSIPQSFQPLLPLPQKLNQTKPNHHCLPSTVTTQTRRQEKSI